MLCSKHTACGLSCQSCVKLWNHGFLRTTLAMQWLGLKYSFCIDQTISAQLLSTGDSQHKKVLKHKSMNCHKIDSNQSSSLRAPTMEYLTYLTYLTRGGQYYCSPNILGTIPNTIYCIGYCLVF